VAKGIVVRRWAVDAEFHGGADIGAGTGVLHGASEKGSESREFRQNRLFFGISRIFHTSLSNGHQRSDSKLFCTKYQACCQPGSGLPQWPEIRDCGP